MANWQVDKGNKSCSACERVFDDGEEYYSALLERSETFVRDDYCPECWGKVAKDNFFSFWKTKVSDNEEEPKKIFIDTQVIYMFFTKLEEITTVEKQLFRYLLCLILIRKRFLRLDDFLKEDGCEYLLVWDRQQKKNLKIFNPQATEEHLQNAQKELSCIFDMSFDDEEISESS